MRYACLVLDHDDTVVQSTPAIHYPSFVEALQVLRPERAEMTLDEFIGYGFDPGILPLLRDVLQLNEEEMAIEQRIWRKYTTTALPKPYDGFDRLFARFRARGGKICVVSHSERDVILRHYRELFGFDPDQIFGWELPEEKRKPHPYPLDAIMREFSLAPSDLLMVDDLKPGMDMARKRQVDFAWAGWSHTGPYVGKVMLEQAKYCLYSPSELEQFLEIDD